MEPRRIEGVRDRGVAFIEGSFMLREEAIVFTVGTWKLGGMGLPSLESLPSVEWFALLVVLAGGAAWIGFHYLRMKKQILQRSHLLQVLQTLAHHSTGYTNLRDRLQFIYRCLAQKTHVCEMGLLFYNSHQERFEGFRLGDGTRIIEIQYTPQETARVLMDALRNEETSGTWECIPIGPHRATFLLKDGRQSLGILWLRFESEAHQIQAEPFMHIFASHLALQLKTHLLYEQAIRDGLTRLYTRGYVIRRIYEEFSNFRRHQFPMGLIMLDLDDFKAINDALGHMFGDKVLQIIGDTIRRGVREGDVPGRFGGDEFLILLPRTPTEDARRVAERIQQAIHRLNVPELANVGIRLGSTMGIVGERVLPFVSHPRELVQLVDMVLLKAKQRKRGQIWTVESIEDVDWRSVIWPVGWA